MYRIRKQSVPFLWEGMDMENEGRLEEKDASWWHLIYFLLHLFIEDRSDNKVTTAIQTCSSPSDAAI